ncbi:MAG: GGDEF domain-containing protein [Magnetospiraceae bacterium]
MVEHESGPRRPPGGPERKFSDPVQRQAAGRLYGMGGSPAAKAQPAANKPSVLDIPQREMTPAVLRSIEDLSGQVEYLRFELERARERQSYLERLADEDAWLPTLNRRAFLRELRRMIDHGTRTGVTSCFIYFDVQNADDIKRRFGLGLRDSVLLEAIAVLKGHLRRSDIIGALGGNDIGMVLVISDSEGAVSKAERLASLLQSRRFGTGPMATNLRVAPFVQTLKPEDTPEQLLARIEADIVKT